MTIDLDTAEFAFFLDELEKRAGKGQIENWKENMPSVDVAKMAFERKMKKLMNVPENTTYTDHLAQVADADVARLREKDAQYGGSWQRRGGVGAFMMAARKWDRIEKAMEITSYDIFAAIRGDQRPEGIIDDIRDLRGYLILIEAEMMARGVVE